MFVLNELENRVIECKCDRRSSYLIRCDSRADRVLDSVGSVGCVWRHSDRNAMSAILIMNY